jgi:hypothetical protein
MPAILRYARATIRKPRTGQRVRLQATVPADTPEVFNLTSDFGNYARATQTDGNILFAYTHYPVPASYEHNITASATGDCDSPRFAFTPRQRIHLVYHCPGEIHEQTSDDDGLTWSGVSLTFLNVTHPDILCTADGTILRSAYDPVGGKLVATRQYAGETAASSPFFLKDDVGADLLVEDDCFRIVAAPSGVWWLHVRLDASAATSIHFSTDDGETWDLVSGSVTGITGGTHPGMTCGHDGTLWAYAYLGGELAFTRRYPGEVDFSAPVSVQDDLGADLAVKDMPSSMAPAWEGPDRLVLATILTTHIGPSDHWSADSASTWKRFLGT